MPVRAHAAPVALVIAIQGAQAVEVHTDAPVPSPSPLSAAMHAVVVVIATPQVPVAANLHPARTGPAPQDAQAVQVTANASPSSPEPARASVVVVAPPQVPIRAHATPMALAVAIQGAQPVQVHTDAPEPAPSPSVAPVQVMVVIVAAVQVPVAPDLHPTGTGPTPQDAQAVQVHANAPESSPSPLRAAMEAMVVVIATPQVPVAADLHPARAGPSPQDTQPVLMAADSSSSAPEPPRSSVIMVASPQVPVCAHATPTALVVAVQGTQTIQMHTNAPEPAPPPLVATMQMMVVVVAAVQMPVRSNTHPVRTCPTPQGSQSVLMATDSTITTPEPPRSLVIMIATIQVPV
jgi:hypothetical protein